MTIKVETVSSLMKVSYGNRFYCEYIKSKDSVSNIRFRKNKKDYLTYLPDEKLETLKNSIWQKHGEVLSDYLQFADEKWIHEFNQFDSLYCVGVDIDGMLRKSDGTPISTPSLIDSTHFKIYEKLETKKENVEKYLKNLKNKYIKESKIVEIPYYNRSDEADGHFTLELVVKFSQEEYIQLLGKSTWVSSDVKQKMVEFIKKKS